MADNSFTPAELNDGFVVAIEIDAKAGEEQAVADALGALIAPTMAEPGVKLFLPYRSPTDPKAFFIFELYRNEAGWAEHQSTGHFKAFAETMTDPAFLAEAEKAQLEVTPVSGETIASLVHEVYANTTPELAEKAGAAMK